MQSFLTKEAQLPLAHCPQLHRQMIAANHHGLTNHNQIKSINIHAMAAMLPCPFLSSESITPFIAK
jgi:hypothetical protein